ncbi:glycosyltransferase family 4 protein [Candidatus Saccharibacteria bacterium]|jgi:glycosyltransferase involved in cell wall biosynthesis|nr:glycosyltransferase family 4 protein [Candidatus Saccharibacteria bacterium]
MSHIAIDARIISSSTGRYVERLIHYLEKVDTKNRYTILVRKKDIDFYHPTNPRFSVKVADFKDYSFSEQVGFLKLLNKLNADLVHFCMPQQPILYTKPHVTTVHDLTLLKTYNSDKNWLVFRFKQLIGKMVFKIICHTSIKIFVPSKYTKVSLENYSSAAIGKTILTYEAADKLQANKTETYNHPFEKFLLYVGQQSDYKNIARLAEAHQMLLKKHPNLGLILVGKINAAVKKNQTHFTKKKYKNIHFTDFIPDEQRDWLFENCAAYVFPSLMEGFGLPGLEAMQQDAPVISSNATCLPEIYGDAAHYFDPYDTKDMARAIGEVLDSKPLRRKLVRKGRLKVNQYSWEMMARQTLEGYESALQELNQN